MSQPWPALGTSTAEQLQEANSVPSQHAPHCRGGEIQKKVSSDPRSQETLVGPFLSFYLWTLAVGSGPSWAVGVRRVPPHPPPRLTSQPGHGSESSPCDPWAWENEMMMEGSPQAPTSCLTQPHTPELSPPLSLAHDRARVSWGHQGWWASRQRHVAWGLRVRFL